MAQKRSRRKTRKNIVELARAMQQSLGIPPVEPRPLEAEEIIPPEKWLGVEGRQLDPIHAWLLARASIAHHLVWLFAKKKRLPEKTVSAVFAIIDFQFNFTCAPKLLGTPDNPAPPRDYAEVAKIVGQFVNRHCSELPLLKGRPRKAPPDSSWFSGIEELAERFHEMQEDVVRPYKRRLGSNAWSSGAATKRVLNPERFDEVIDQTARESFESSGVTLDDLRDQPLRRFLLARLKEEPTAAALHVAWTLAKVEHGYDGNLRAFSDAWHEHRKRSRPD
jgi:hypothetical protein